MSDSLGISRTIAQGNSHNEIAMQQNRNIAIRQAVNLKNYNTRKSNLINNVSQAKIAASGDSTGDREKEGMEGLTVLQDAKHIQSTMVGRAKQAQSVFTQAQSSLSATGAAKGSVPQGDKSVVENPLQDSSADGANVFREADTVKGGNQQQLGEIAEAASRGKILEPSKVTTDVTSNPAVVPDTVSSTAAEVSSVAADSSRAAETSGGAALRYGGYGLRGLNIAGGAIDLAQDFSKGKFKVAGNNIVEKGSNLAGIGSGAAESIGVGAAAASGVATAAGFETAGAALDLTGAGAVVGIPLQIAGAALGAASLIGGVIGDVFDKEKKDSGAVKSASKAVTSQGPAPTAAASTSYQAPSLSGSYAGKSDSQGRIQGTGAF
tara:strand:- start:10633 stop:11766 length:1134 start_codon:yes stop_codon:yes gene_type:complete